MIWTLFVLMLVLWVLGMLSAWSLGGFVHLLLALAIAFALLNAAAQRRTA
jgi:hypothetical protein